MANAQSLDFLVSRWRTSLAERRSLSSRDVEELEAHLRDQVTSLMGAGLDTEEAFLVAIRRMGRLDLVSQEFAREHSDRLWKQLVWPEVSDGSSNHSGLIDPRAAGLALAAAVAIKLPELFGFHLHGVGQELYARNLSLFVLPMAAAWFAWTRGVKVRVWIALATGFSAAAVAANVYPFSVTGQTARLTGLHLPIALWALVGVAYVGGKWQDATGRMNFIRFSGELLIYYVLIALGGAVFALFVSAMFSAIGLDVTRVVQLWILPCGAMGAVIVGAWLVEAKQSVIENIAPVLTRLFTPLFMIALLSFLAVMLWTGQGIDVKREVLIGFDLLLAVVLGLFLYAVSARDPERAPDVFDVLQLILIASALLVDAIMLLAILARISEFGFSPNKVAALGENLILFVNLARSCWLLARFVAGRGSFGTVSGWQTAYLPLYVLWAITIVVGFPPLFRYS